MDDKNQILSQNQANAQTQPQTQALQGQKQPQNQQQPQTGGVGSLVKEHGPIATGELRPSRPEPEIHRELQEIVKSVPEFPEVKPDERQVGISPAKESVPVKTTPSGLNKIPMTEDEAKQELKHENPTNSNWGYLALFVKFFKTIHHKLLTNKN